MNKITLHSLDQLLVHLGQNAKTKGIEFELSCKWFLENDPEYKQKLQKVWSWNDWPGSNGKRDTGIDLIAQDIEDKIWAIQVKAYDENYYITKADIDSFLSASSRSDISFRLLIATTNKIGSIGRDTFADQEKPVSLCLRDKLEISPVDWMLSLTDTKFIQKNIKAPREHQQHALNAIIKGFEITPSKGQVHMACGTGKSLLGLWLAQKLQAQHTLVLVPSLSLVGQLRRTWAENSDDFVFDSIFVCSDQTVGYKHSNERQEAFEMGFPATTNAHELIQQLLSNSRPKVIFSTYHSSMVIEEVCKLKLDLMFDLVIADEAHRCVGKVQSDFAIITDDNKIRAHRKLYMTATPRIYTEYVKNKTQEYECEIVSMDDEEKFGPVLYKLPFSDAIKQELLTDYQVVISVIDHHAYRNYAEKGKFINIDNYETDARKIATQLLIAQAIQKYGLKNIISFHNGVSVAQDFIQTIPKAIELLPQDERPQIDYCSIVHGEQSQSERYKILKNFGNPDFTGAVIIGNDRCLREGIDIPALDGIVFADPKNSEVDIIQAVGRAIRLSGDKKIGTIIIPVFIDKQSQGVEDLENSCFKKVWQIIKALRMHDDVLAEELDTIRLELGKRTYKTPAKLPSKIITDVSVKIDADFARLIEGKIVEGMIERHSTIYLTESHPEIAKQWHVTKNGNLTPKDFTFGMSAKIWWQCNKGVDHEWQTTILNRTMGYGCPVCTNQLAVLSNCLATTHQSIAAEWHSIKNPNITSYDVVAGSGKKVWWQCQKGVDHEWQATIEKRTKEKTGCPMCSGKSVVLSTCLATTHPEIAKEWHSTKNGNLTSRDVTFGSSKQIWWKCDKGDDHEWKAPVNHRVSGTKCSICDNKKVVLSNCLATTHSTIAKQWHSTKNGKETPYNITAGSNKKRWWKCDKGNDHEWLVAVYKRIPNSDCPICINRLVVLSNCLATTHLEISKRLIDDLNNGITPFNVTIVSSKKAWFHCINNKHQLFIPIKNTASLSFNRCVDCEHL